jgi:hypothetical protein
MRISRRMNEGVGLIVWSLALATPAKYKPTPEVGLDMRNAVQEYLTLEDGTDSLS